MFYRISNISFTPPRGGHHLKNVSVSFTDPDGKPFITIHGIQLSRSNRDNSLYCACPCNFYHSFVNGQKHVEIAKNVEWPLDTWREISRAIIAEYERQFSEPEPLTPDWINREVCR